MRTLLGGGAKKEATKKAQLEALQRQEEENVRRREEMVERLLPWGLEQKVAVFLNPVKVPFILAVGVLGCVAEAKVAAISDGAFSRGWFEAGPQCMVHRAKYENLKLQDPRLSNVAESLNEFFRPTIESINHTVLNNSFSRCYMQDNQTRCNLFNTSYVNLTFQEDFCGVEYDPETHVCSEPGSTHTPLAEDQHPGIEYRLPFLPYSLIWMVFKLVFLPVHAVDRLANMAEGWPQPMPEPMWKLLTEPHCNPESGAGKACGVLRPLSIISKIIRFSLLPNSLILPLVTLRTPAKCPDYIVYTQDVKFSWLIYYWLILDFVVIATLYVLGKTVFGGQAISKMWYRAWKCLTLPATVIALTLFMFDVITVFNWRFWQGLKIVLRIMFTLKLGFDFTLDVTQTLANVVIILDGLQLTVMIMSFLCPKMLDKVGLPDWVLEWVERPGDTNANRNGRGGAAQVQPAETEAQALLTGDSQGSSASDLEQQSEQPPTMASAPAADSAANPPRSTHGAFGALRGAFSKAAGS